MLIYELIVIFLKDKQCRIKKGNKKSKILLLFSSIKFNFNKNIFNFNLTSYRYR